MLRRIMMMVALVTGSAGSAIASTCLDDRGAPSLALQRSGGPDGRGQRIVASDQQRGDVDARAFEWLGGAGYRMHAWSGPGDLSLLRGFAGVVGGAPLPRRDATSDTLRPWGHEVRYESGAVEALQLQAGHPALSVCVQGGGKPVALLLMLGPDAGAHSMAWVGSVPVQRVDADAALRRAVGAPDDIEWLLLETETPAKALTVHLAFGPTAKAAEATLQALQREADAESDSDLWAAGLERRRPALDALRLRTGDARFDAAFRWAIASNATFRADEFGPGLWAGLPWFRDNWGRDTFIALPGTHLVTGEFARARAVIANFARLQNDAVGAEQGRVPNRVAAASDTLYNTVDGTPWLIRSAWETAQASGDAGGLPALRVLIRDYVAGAEPHLDADGLLRHAEADTWMDARIRGGRGWSPRGDRAIEIQALWHSVLVIGADLATREGDADEAARYAAMAERARAAVLRRYWIDGRLADRLLPDDRADTSVRPNAWLAVSVPPLPARFPFLPREIEESLTRDTTAALLLPRGPLSLAANDPRFHPKHVDDARHHKDAAYHNGTVWQWTAGPAITALTRFGQQETAYRVTSELARQILEDDAPGHLAELADATHDAQGRVRPSGTYAQSWSTAEFVRNAVQDYLGVHPRLLEGVVELNPALPAAWTDVDAVLPLGQGEPLRFTVTQREGRQRWTFAAREAPLTLALGGSLAATGTRVVVHDAPLEFDVAVPDAPAPWPLAAEPSPPAGGWPVLQGRDVLERFIQSGGLDRHPQPTVGQLLAPPQRPEDSP
ncbi:MAG: amylo-alpha-1,6-glucosidase [Silanimonas sp.]